MVFPSRGCRTCVQRRIKCDTSHPICGRCEKASRECIWSPNEQAGLQFKSENAFAKGQARRPRAPKGGQQIVLPVSKPAIPSPQPALALSLDDHAFKYWANHYVSRPEDLHEAAHEWHVHVLPHWIKTKPASCLHLAVLTLSHAVFGRARGVPQALIQADRSYAQCLAQTQLAVGGHAKESIDDLLLTAMLMGYFENIRFNGGASETSARKMDAVGSRFTNVFCHYEGAMGLLKVRRERGSGADITLDRVTRRQIIRAAILRGNAVPDWLQDGAEYLEEGPALQLDSLMVRVAAFRSRSLAFFSNSTATLPTSTPDLEYLAHTGKELEDDLVQWAESVPVDWKAKRKSVSEDEQTTYSNAVNIYASHGQASIWLRQRALRFIINSIFIKFIAVRMQTETDRTHLQWKQNRMRGNLDSISSELCCDVPFFFNSSASGGGTGPDQSLMVGNPQILPKLAGLVAWPLAVAVSTENVPESQRQWLQRKLKVVASSLGDSVLEAVADRGEFRF